MKPYFAKYLPVEGEIKEGDLYSCPHKGHALKIEGLPLAHSPKMVICKHKIGGGMICNDCYKIKLFLCSRDIQVGDTVKELLTTGEWMGWKIDNENDLDLKNQVKVIGEISPKAIWVKEGDEFDEDQIKKKGKLAVNHYVDWIEGREKLGYECMIFILCPTCKKFQ